MKTGLIQRWLATAALLVLSAIPVAGEGVTRIAFGSCSHQSRSQAHWEPILKARPDVFIFCGDNIYSDTYDMALMRKKYGQMAAQPGFQKLKKSARILAVWDDHDYGLNDSGGEFPKKKEAQKEFLDFWGVAANSPRRKREGVYDATLFKTQGRTVQVILLDTRYFRTPLRKLAVRQPGQGRYASTREAGATFLGETQWAWLDEQLKAPADVRLIVSSIQVVAQDHNWEKWMNFPNERQRLLGLLKKHDAKGVIFVTGDRHHGELSVLRNNALGYPLYDITSSGLNMTHAGLGTEPNRHRVGPIIGANNFGLITIDWGKESTIDIELRTLDGKTALKESVRLSDLQPKPTGKPRP